MPRSGGVAIGGSDSPRASRAANRCISPRSLGPSKAGSREPDCTRRVAPYRCIPPDRSSARSPTQRTRAAAPAQGHPRARASARGRPAQAVIAAPGPRWSSGQVRVCGLLACGQQRASLLLGYPRPGRSCRLLAAQPLQPFSSPTLTAEHGQLAERPGLQNGLGVRCTSTSSTPKAPAAPWAQQAWAGRPV